MTNLPPKKTNIVKYFLIFFNKEEILEIFQYFHNMGLCQYDKGNIVRGTELAQLLVIHLIYSEINPFRDFCYPFNPTSYGILESRYLRGGGLRGPP